MSEHYFHVRYAIENKSMTSQIELAKKNHSITRTDMQNYLLCYEATDLILALYPVRPVGRYKNKALRK